MSRAARRGGLAPRGGGVGAVLRAVLRAVLSAALGPVLRTALGGALGVMIGAVLGVPGPARAAEAPPLWADQIRPSGPGEETTPDGTRLALRGALVPESYGARLYFVDAVADVELIRAATRHALRAGFQYGLSQVPGEGRQEGEPGNVRLEYWYVGRWRRPFGLGEPPDAGSSGARTREALSVGVFIPTRSPSAVGGAFFEQRSEISYPTRGLWLAYLVTWSGADYAIEARLLAGLVTWPDTFFGVTGIGHASVTGSFRVTDTLAATVAGVLPGEAEAPNPTLLVGVRWRPIDQLDVAPGVHLVPRALLDDDDALSVVRPVIEVGGRF